MDGEKIIKFYNYYTRMVSEAKYESIHGEWSKILTKLSKFFKDYQ